LSITGEKGTLVVGKELEIRRILSESHLKSSAFEVRFEGDEIVLMGSGWGHGVGLCQIGAAVMASKGYTYKEILNHYYPESVIEQHEQQ
jgi:SpoIID/LytB domain protein